MRVRRASSKSGATIARTFLADVRTVAAAKDLAERQVEAEHLLGDLNKVWFVWAMDSLDGKVIDAMIPLLRDWWRRKDDSR